MRRFLHLLAWLCLPSVALMAQDTTASRFLAYSDGGEMVLFNEDSSNFYYGPLPIVGPRYPALWNDPASGDLIAVIDSGIQGGNRNFYKLEPFTGARTLIYDPPTTYLASADVTPGGRVFGITGHGGTAGQIFEYDLVNQTTTPFAAVNLVHNLTASATNLTYDAATDDLWIFFGAADSVYKVDLATAAVTVHPANLRGVSTLKATYYDGNQLLICSDRPFTVNPSVSFDLDTLAFVLPDYLAEIVLLDLIRTPDTMVLCAGDSAVIEGRFQSLAYIWYRNDTATTFTTQNLTVTQPGTYRLLVQTDDVRDFFMWSEPVVVVQGPNLVASIVVPDTLEYNSAGTFVYPFGGPSVSVVWDFGNGDTLSGDSVGYEYPSGTPPGPFVVTATITTGPCTVVVEDTLFLNNPVGVEDPMIRGLFFSALYPNPVHDVLFVNVEANKAIGAEIEVLNALGQPVAVLHRGTLSATAQSFTWDTRPHASGLYTVRLRTDAGSVARRVLVQH